jgi:hypothetical protein
MRQRRSVDAASIPIVRLPPSVGSGASDEHAFIGDEECP